MCSTLPKKFLFFVSLFLLVSLACDIWVTVTAPTSPATLPADTTLPATITATQTLFTGDRLKGQFAFKLNNAPDHQDILAQFHFDFDLPIYSEIRFYPKQAVSANGLEMLLDSVAVTPAFTHAYVCFPPPSYTPWTIGSETILQIEEQQAPLHNFRLLFGADLGGDRSAGSEPYWAPPTKNERRVKVGFAIGNSSPTSLTLSIPELAQEDPEVLLSNQLSLDYPGLSPRNAYHIYLAEHGKVYKGPWVFTVQLTP